MPANTAETAVLRDATQIPPPFICVHLIFHLWPFSSLLGVLASWLSLHRWKWIMKELTSSITNSTTIVTSSTSIHRLFCSALSSW